MLPTVKHSSGRMILWGNCSSKKTEKLVPAVGEMDGVKNGTVVGKKKKN